MDILEEKRFGLILRTFAKRPEDVQNRVQALQKVVARAQGLEIRGRRLFSRIDILVWCDTRYRELNQKTGELEIASDCGETVAALRSAIKGHGVQVHEFRHGDIFVDILNYGIGFQLRNRVDYSVIVSTEAMSYMTSETMDDMVTAAERGALAIGVAINELTESVLEGRLANTFAMWHNVSLVTAGNFNARASKPRDDREAEYRRGWTPEAGTVWYPVAGVEEAIPLARLVDVFDRPCIAPIRPRGDGIQRYEIPDPVRQPELWLRQNQKMGTKLDRQRSHLEYAGYNTSFLKGGVMPAYRDPAVFPA